MFSSVDGRFRQTPLYHTAARSLSLNNLKIESTYPLSPVALLPASLRATLLTATLLTATVIRLLPARRGFLRGLFSPLLRQETSLRNRRGARRWVNKC